MLRRGDPIQCYADPTTRGYMLCMMFYRFMKHRRKGVKHFTEAITRLEAINDKRAVYDRDEALALVRWAVNFAYGDND